MKLEVTSFQVPEEGELTNLKSRAVVALAHLLKEEGEQAVWAVIQRHYDINHGVLVFKQCDYCQGTGIYGRENDEEGNEVEQVNCPRCFGKGKTY